MKKKVVVKKRKVMDVFIEPKKKEIKAVVHEIKKCDCGSDSHPGSHQCWACSHRA